MNLRSIDLNLLVIFDALIGERSVTGAARKIGITPSAMSHALRRLRDTFNDQLLERTGRGMVPTQRAVELWTSVRAALEQLQRAVDQQLEFDPRTSERTFTVRISDYLVQCAVPRLCARVRAEAPNTTLIVDDLPGDRPGTDNPGDIQIRVCADDWGPEYRQQRVLLNNFVVAMRRGHPAAGRRILNGAGHTVHEAKNGEEGLGLFHQVHPALVITDIVMPDMEGIELIRKLHEEAPTIPILAISGRRPSLYLELATGLGATAALAKPFGSDELLAAVGLLLGTA